jgi:hypothetical protein
MIVCKCDTDLFILSWIEDSQASANEIKEMTFYLTFLYQVVISL